MKNQREEWYDAERKVSVVIVDVSEAAQTLAKGHLAGPVSAHYLTKALAAVALLGTEISEKEESVILQMKCEGPLGGFNVECTAEGTLRGYTEKKVLDEFDGRGEPKDEQVIGKRQIQVTRSVVGRIISQGISNSLDGYLAGSLQRKACIYLEAAVNDEVEVKVARGVMIEAMPDSKELVSAFVPEKLNIASRSILKRMGLSGAELKRVTPLKFACRCSPERAAAMIAALSKEERETLPESIDVTCHMCGKSFTIKCG